MTPLHTLCLALIFALVPACGGSDADQDPTRSVDLDDTEQSEAAQKPQTVPGGVSSCSAAAVTCRDAQGQVTGTARGCSISCASGQTADCSAGRCSGRVTVHASCGCFTH